MSNVLPFIICLFSLSLISCASIKKQAVNLYLNKLKDTKAKQVSYPRLPYRYVKQNHVVLDAFWWNKKNKSSISYFSSCPKVSQNLKAFQSQSFPKNAIIIKHVKTDKHLYAFLKLKQSIHIGIYTLQIKNCYFNINLVSPSLKSFKKEQDVFKSFVKEFKLK